MTRKISVSLTDVVDSLAVVETKVVVAELLEVVGASVVVELLIVVGNSVVVVLLVVEGASAVDVVLEVVGTSLTDEVLEISDVVEASLAEVVVGLIVVVELDEATLVVIDNTDEEDWVGGVLRYILSLILAPHVSLSSPEQGKLQSERSVGTLPALIVFPQKHSRPYSTPNHKCDEQTAAHFLMVRESL